MKRQPLNLYMILVTTKLNCCTERKYPWVGWLGTLLNVYKQLKWKVEVIHICWICDNCVVNSAQHTTSHFTLAGRPFPFPRRMRRHFPDVDMAPSIEPIKLVARVRHLLPLRSHFFAWVGIYVLCSISVFGELLAEITLPRTLWEAAPAISQQRFA